ncbi:hypothetical protein [Saccharopolyspora sp. 5N708]|uniref:hypothetical protein n=1 Tax=Saccharopolyspora sp. 5N708 TaxID=3457424 RepID=UPI003FD41BB3
MPTERAPKPRYPGRGAVPAVRDGAAALPEMSIVDFPEGVPRGADRRPTGRGVGTRSELR